MVINAGAALNATGAFEPPGWLASNRISTASAGALALTASSGDTLDFTQNGGYASLYLGSVGPNTFSGTLIPAGGAYRLGGGGGTLTASTNLTGSNNLAVAGPGSVILAGSDDFSGTTSINSGTLQLGSSTALYSGAAVNNVALGGVFDLGGFNAGIAGRAAAGP